jgi:hypothetical protein
MSEPSERIIDTAPEAPGCTVTRVSSATAPDRMVHQ